MVVDLDIEELLIMGDSDLIIRQAQGKWETRDIKLIPYKQHVENLRNGSSPSSSEPDVQPWYHDIKRFLKTKEYLEQASKDQKRIIRRLASSFFLSGEVLYKRTPDLNLLRCVDAKEDEKIMNKVHLGIHGDLIHAPPSELHPMSAPWTFVSWGMDVIGPIEPKASNGHKFILVAIDYFTKQVEVVTFKAVTKKAVMDLVHSTSFVILSLDEGEVEILSLRIIFEAEIEDDEWVKTQLEQLTMIDEKRMTRECYLDLLPPNERNKMRDSLIGENPHGHHKAMVNREIENERVFLVKTQKKHYKATMR
ncbi:uncharacterized protein [Nicotiana tomentosiformis]|uniref:uncharacterized protein n=1 Tax=Nicotiana tomentosiformis TaxID=4098 RepID=UPI00388C74FA